MSQTWTDKIDKMDRIDNIDMSRTQRAFRFMRWAAWVQFPDVDWVQFGRGMNLTFTSEAEALCHVRYHKDRGYPVVALPYGDTPKGEKGRI